MKRKALFFVLAVLSFRSMAQSDTTALRQLAIATQSRYVPDPRDDYFRYQLRNDTVYIESTRLDALNSFAGQFEGHFKGTVLKKSLLPDSSTGLPSQALINISVSNNRAQPRNAAEMMTQALLGTPVQVLKKQGGYYLVRTPDGYVSWTDAAALAVKSAADYQEWMQAPKVVIATEYSHALAEPKDNTARVSDLVAGNILRLTGKQGKYAAVQFPDGRKGFVLSENVAPYERWIKRADPDARAILKTARTLVGVPYLWGGTSIKGVDCSGFTKTSYFLNGIIIPRDASQQALVGEKVDILDGDTLNLEKSLKNLQPGDLLFFSGAKSRGRTGRISHTAIYIGQGEFIQSAGMVRINSMVPGTENYDDFQSRTLVAARRYLGQIGKTGITRVGGHPWYRENR